MYDYIKGKLTYRDYDSVVVEAGGIGFRVFCANPASIPAREGQEVMLFVHPYIREDAHMLFGFKTREERQMFRLLLEVSGIGPKGALSILASSSPQQIALAIVQEDEKYLTRFPGIGQKTAKRLILDLKDKLKKEAFGRFGVNHPPDTDGASAQERPQGFFEALEALLVLGFKEDEALPVVKEIVQEAPDLTIDEMVREALKRLNRF